MTVKGWIKIIAIGCCLIILTGCMARKHNSNAAINDANAAYAANQESGARATGLGEHGRFGEGQNDQILAKRVYYFDFDSNIVHDADKPAIEGNADYLAAHGGSKVMLEGHTDPRGSREYNIGLGERRAKAVAQILTSKGTSPEQIRVVSYGAEKPAAYGRTESDYQKDRRAVLVYLKR